MNAGRAEHVNTVICTRDHGDVEAAAVVGHIGPSRHIVLVCSEEILDMLHDSRNLNRPGFRKDLTHCTWCLQSPNEDLLVH